MIEQVSKTASFTPEKQKLLARLLAKKGIERSRTEQILPRRDTGPCVASFGQQRLWFLDQVESDKATYNVTSVVRLMGNLDVRVLEECFNEIVRRHEALRTTFEEGDEQLLQVIAPELRLSLPVTDVSHVAPERLEAEVGQLVDELVYRPFDLSRGPLMRVELLKLGDEEHLLLFMAHHIIIDAWSIGVLIQELSALYSAFLTVSPSPLQDLKLQYADFAHWQRAWMSGERLEQQLEYWRGKLEGAPAALQLPTDRPRTAAHGSRGGEVTLPLSDGLLEQLKGLGQESGATLFMVLLAAYKLLLARYSGQWDIAVGTPIANRHHAEIEPLIGFFVNTLVLRDDLSGDLSFRQLLERVRATALGAYAHQDLPLERLVEELGPERRSGRAPLFQVMFALGGASSTQLELPGLTVSPYELDSRNAKSELALYIETAPGRSTCGIAYSADLFDEGTIRQMLGHFERLLEGAVSEPDTAVSELPMLTADEEEQLVHVWNDTARAVEPATLHELFERQAALNPELNAAVDERETLTYAQLDARANQLAHHLIGLGLSPESRVGICLERSASMVVGVMGVLKAGAAYLPLDPAYPRERLAFMLADSDVEILLTGQGLAEGLAEPRLGSVLMDRDRSVISECSAEPPARDASWDHLAYVIYTSGSTGRPKGVECSHRGVVNLLADFDRRQPLAAGTRCSAWTSLSFDVSVYEIFSALLSGCELHLVPPTLRLDAWEMSGWLGEHRIGSAYVPPFMLATLCDWVAQHPGDLELKRLLVGVEPIEERLLVDLAASVPGLKIINGYGPTEASICATLYDVGDQAKHQQGPAPIGRPVVNSRVYVLDARQLPVPIGVAGELYIGEEGLARGYFERAGLTAERFVPDGVSGHDGRRLYRTGDRVKLRPDGELEFLGRVDHQVKVRGYRIEPGEIEARLCELAGVRRAVVMALDDKSGAKSLVAYVERAPGDAATETALKDGLKQQLPEFMLPSVFVLLDDFPQTANGKVDRDALPAPNREPSSQTRYVAPRTELEIALSRIWADLLSLERVGLDDDFFKLGGHSLLATQAVSRVRKTLGVELPVTGLFEEPTIRQLAHSIEQEQWQEKLQLPLVPVEREAGTQTFPQSFAQQRIWFLDQLDPNTSTYNIPSALSIRGDLNVKAMEESFNELIRRHESLRTTFALQDGQLVQIVAPELSLSLALSNLGALPADQPEARARELIDEETQRPFDLTRGPLLRAMLLQLEPREYILLFTMHHIISDAWSMGILVEEFKALYTAFCEGQPSPLAPLPIQYPDFTLWQADWLQFGVVEELLSYWRDQIRGVPPITELLTDRPRTAAQTSRGADVSFQLDRELSSRLRDFGAESGATMYMVMLAAFKALLYRYTGQHDLIVGSPIAGRPHQELEPLIGFFVNTLVLRSDLSGEPSFRELVDRVRATSLDAYAHQDLPFERLVEQLGPERRWGRSPLFQIMFVLQNAPATPLELPGLTLEPLALQGETAKFDLTLQVQDSPDVLSGAMEYSTDLFDEGTIRRMLGHFERLLEGAMREPDAAVNELPLLTADEEDQLVHGWNDTAREVEPATLHLLFERQAARTPELIAVVDGREELTYAQLDARANQLAHHLIGLGLGPESRVGICLERSVSMVVGVLGVLKAGAAYLPLDPAYPRDRLAFMLADGEVEILLSEKGHAEGLTEPRLGTVLVDRDRSAIAERSTASPARDVSWDQLAYLIYTSGSTGRPKGVMIEHRSSVALIHWAHDFFLAEELQDVLASTSLCFDLSIFELFAPLTCGGRVVVASNLFDLASQQQVSLVNTVPSLMQELLRSGSLPPGVRTINLAGEALPLGLVRSLRRAAPDARIVNLYGPSEDTTYSTVYDLPRGLEREPWIGVPIANTQAYVLDQVLRPVPVGVTGEVYLGGAGLTRGYLARAQLTAERFSPDPFSGASGARLYRTGDRGHIRSDGNLAYLGRADGQVKLRGCRIELGEIESTLNELTGARRAVAMVREDKPGDKRLVAYLELPQGEAPTAAEMKEMLKQELPDFMVPSAFVVLPALPQTITGKIDRGAFPAPERAEPDRLDAPTPARDELESWLVDLWEELLDYSPIGIRESFFELGGHSLLALRMQAQVRGEFGVDLPLSALFENATIAHLAAVVRGRLDEAESVRPGVMRSPGPTRIDAGDSSTASGVAHSPADSDVLVPIQTRGSGQPFFCVHPIGGGVLCYAELARQLGQERPFYGLQARTDLGESESFDEIACRYLSAIRSVQPTGPYLLGGWSMGGLVAYEMAQQLDDAGDEVALLALLDSFPLLPEHRDVALDERQLLAGFAEDLAALSGVRHEDMAAIYEAAASLPDAELLAWSLAPLQELQVVPEEIDLAQFNQIWQLYRSNYAALARYEPRRYGGKVTLIMSAETYTQQRRMPLREWAPLAGGGLSIDVLPGDHYSLLKNPEVQLTARKLEGFLAAAESDSLKAYDDDGAGGIATEVTHG